MSASMMTYRVKQEGEGWAVFTGPDQITPPSPDRETAEAAAADYARNQFSKGVSAQVVTRGDDGVERPVVTFGDRPRFRVV